MGATSTVNVASSGVLKTASNFAGLFPLLACLCVGTSCISPEQKRVVLSWYDTSEAALKFQEPSPTGNMTSAEVEKRIGKPDQRVPAALLSTVLPGRWGNDEANEAIEQRSRQLVHSGRDPSPATQEVGISEFWLYDESARYKSPSQPDSFWGMGTGFQVVWFVVYKDQVIASGGLGLRKTRRLIDH